MKKLYNLFLLVILLAGSFAAKASSHREAPSIADDPLADNTDLYAFRSPDNPDYITIIANYIPFELPQGGPNYATFGENIRYEIHIDNNISTPGDDIIYRFTFTHTNEDPTTFFNIRLGAQNIKTTYTCERSTDGGVTFTTIISDGMVPPPNIGARSISDPVVGLGTTYAELINSAITPLPGGGRVYCGPADDPFFVDLGGVFDLGDMPRQSGDPHDGVACMNVHVIAIQVPISALQKDGLGADMAANILDPDFVIGVWASASRQTMRTLNTDGTTAYSGEWVQVSRLGMPLTNEAVIPVGQKDYWNSLSPYAEDAALFEYFYNPELGLYMDDALFGGAVPALAPLRIQKASLGAYNFSNGADGLYPLKGSPAVAGTALDDAVFGTLLLPAAGKPRSVDLWPIFFTGAPNLAPYQLATGKDGNPLAAGKPFINNFLPNGGDMLRLNMAVPPTPRTDPAFSTLGLVQAAVLGLTDPTYNATADLQWIPNMDGFPNGRRLEDDVTRIELQAVSGIVLAAIGLWYDDYDPMDIMASPVTPQLLNVLTYETGVGANDVALKDHFPYVQKPWAGDGKCGGLTVDYFAETDCDVPTDLNASAVDPTTEYLSWSAEEGTVYRLEYRTAGGGVITKVPVVANFHTLGGLTACTAYEYRVVVHCPGDGKLTSDWYPFTTDCRLGGILNNALSLFPNPANAVVHAQYVAETNGSMRIKVLDVTGTVYIDQTQKVRAGLNNFDLNVESLTDGMYFVQIKMGDEQTIGKIIISH
ncbi:MAG: DUF4331 family protein [Chitinophagales bacterium]